MFAAISQIGSAVGAVVGAVKGIIQNKDAKVCKDNVASQSNIISRLMSQMQADQLKFQTENTNIQAQARALQNQVNEWNAKLIQSTQEYNLIVKELQILQEQQSAVASQIDTINIELLGIQKQKLEVDAIETCFKQPFVIGMGVIAIMLILSSSIHLGYSFKKRKHY